MKKYAALAAAVIVLIVVLALLLAPKLTAKDPTVNANVTPEVTATAVPTEAPTAEPTAQTVAATAQPAADPTAEPAAATATDVEAAALTAETVVATVNGKGVALEDVDLIAQNLMYSYSQYGYDVSGSPEMLNTIYQMAMSYAVQLELMEQKAVEWGFDQVSDEDRAELEAEANAEWETLIQTYMTYYVTLPENATDADKAAARDEAITGLAAMGYSVEDILASLLEDNMYNRVEAEMVKDAEVTDEDVQEAFDAKVAEDKAAFAQDVATYEYMTNYYGEESYYIPEGYRGITHILLEVDEELLNNYQTLVAELEELEEAAEEATATDLATAGDLATGTDLVAQSRADVDAAYAAIMASLQPTIDEINAKLAAGTPFADLVAEYGKDPGMQAEPNKSQGYPVHMDSVVWDPVFTQAAFSVDNVGDVAEPVLGSYGVHIVQYTRDVPAGAVELTDDIKAVLREELLANAENELFNAKMDEWMNASEVTYTEAAQSFTTTGAETAE